MYRSVLYWAFSSARAGAMGGVMPSNHARIPSMVYKMFIFSLSLALLLATQSPALLAIRHSIISQLPCVLSFPDGEGGGGGAFHYETILSCVIHFHMANEKPA